LSSRMTAPTAPTRLFPKFGEWERVNCLPYLSQ
jgi:hypothetical protein